jgi:hypothetical protein
MLSAKASISFETALAPPLVFEQPSDLVEAELERIAGKVIVAEWS